MIQMCFILILIILFDQLIDNILPISYINFSYIMMHIHTFFFIFSYFLFIYFLFFIFHFLFLIFYFLLLFIVLNYVLFSFISFIFIFIFIFIHFILFCFNYYFKIFSKPLLQFRFVRNSAKESFSWEENCKMRRYVLDIRY